MNPESWLMAAASFGRGSVEWFWFPVLVWTVVAASVLWPLSNVRGLHPLVACRLRQALLLALPTAFIVAPWVPPLTRAQELLAVLPTGAPLDLTSDGMGAIGTAPDPIGLLLGIALLGVALSTVLSLIGLGRQLYRLHRIAAVAEPIQDAATLGMLQEVSLEVGVSRAVALLGAPSGSTPMTFRWITPWILVPQDLRKAPERLRLVLRHELIHVRRGDAAWSLLERIASAPFTRHPLVRVLERSIAHFREASCDAEVIRGVAEPRAYAELLLDMSGGHSPNPALAPGLFTRNSNLKTRLEVMKRFIHTPPSKYMRTQSVVTSTLLFAVVVAMSACGNKTTFPAATPDALAEEFTSRFGSMAEETRDGALARLEVQMSYLRDRVEEVGTEMQAAIQANEPRAGHLSHQYDLLSRMYLERLETYETLKLERETALRLAEGSR